MAGARKTIVAALVLWLVAVGLVSAPQASATAQTTAQATAHEQLSGADVFPAPTDCMACHNGLLTPGGEDVSIGVSWRASMMANAARDPYWQASVRREMTDHPSKAKEIQTECAVCHRPTGATEDGVSCAVCHQIAPDGLGTRESFVGRFVIAPPPAGGTRQMFGPFKVERGHASVMRSVTGVTPTEGTHVQQSELCATCHTLITQALGTNGEVVGSIPEQVPYLEWKHSAFLEEKRSCQSCHMPPVAAPTRIASVLGEARDDLSRHTFLGGNFFMLRMLNRFRGELGVTALPQELDASAHATVRQLQADTATVSIQRAVRAGGQIEIDLDVRNATGHKLPTGYPSRRAWLHVTVRDGSGAIAFESGAVAPNGAIMGNDNDADPLRVEPHYAEIRRGDEVQIYESVMADVRGAVTTGLLHATQFTKDNRLLPRGFDKASASPDIAVFGAARDDADFASGGDRVRYVISAEGRPGPYNVAVELLYQPIGFRWAQNLSGYDAPEPQRFVKYYDAMAGGSSVSLAHAAARVE
jgi:hypothetical protein